MLIVGLAPGVTGANATGRPFTGDFAGDLLYQTLARFGHSKGTFDRRPDDGLALVDCRITNAVRCVPPENKPLSEEVAACRPFLVAELSSLDRLKAVLALGAVAHGAVLGALLEEHRRGHPVRTAGRVRNEHRDQHPPGPGDRAERDVENPGDHDPDPHHCGP